jgi:hypothetical protein
MRKFIVQADVFIHHQSKRESLLKRGLKRCPCWICHFRVVMSVFTFRGAQNIPVAYPGQYDKLGGEVVGVVSDRRDLRLASARKTQYASLLGLSSHARNAAIASLRII